LYLLNADAIDYSKVTYNQNRCIQETSFEETQNDKCKIVLDFIRNNLDKDIINKFEINSNVDKWREKIEYTKLFELWNLCKKGQSATKSQIKVRMSEKSFQSTNF